MAAPQQYEVRSYAEVDASLPAPRSKTPFAGRSTGSKMLIVLDDDPTGTQTVHDVAVLTTFEKEVLRSEVRQRRSGFFILTNSRAYTTVEADRLLRPLLNDLHEILREEQVDFEVVTRSDSCLRGHFPLEPATVEELLGPFDAWVLAPCFIEGGRVTVDDIHYVKEGASLVPVADTPFSQDKAFGFRSSNLGDWAVEKFRQHGYPSVPQIERISITELRQTDAVRQVARRLEDIISRRSSDADKPAPIIILNAFTTDDVNTFTAARHALKQGRLIFRSGASLVSSYLGISPIPPVPPTKLFSIDNSPSSGGLIIVGSYVPKTTKQLAYLLERCQSHIQHIELSVEVLLASTDGNEALIQQTINILHQQLKAGLDVVVSTSRKLVTHDDPHQSLLMGQSVSQTLCGIVKRATVRPKYVLAKGGITSSDIATVALGMKRATVVGQATIGVPLWESRTEDISKWADVPYIVFPGNVGDEHTLGDLIASYRNSI